VGRRLRSPAVLSIGGYDPSGGAGITADVRTATACGCSASTVLTAFTLQGPRGFLFARPMAPSDVAAQIALLARDAPPRAVKTGMLATSAIVREVVRAVEAGLLPPPVVDPVFVSTSGASLLDAAGRRRLLRELIPRSAVVTPNLGEAAELTGLAVVNLDGMARAAERLAGMGAAAVIVTGGHLRGRPADLVLERKRIVVLSGTRLGGRPVHGLGCAFSMALACHLARGATVVAAARQARRIVRRLILGARGPRGGMRLPGLIRTATLSGVLVAALAAGACGGGPSARVEKLFRARTAGSEAIVVAASEALEDPDFDVRATAVWMLAEAGDRSVAPALSALLADPSPGVRAAAAAGLARLGERVDPALLAPLVHDADPAVRLKAIELLAGADPAGSGSLLLQALGDPNADVRVGALRALAALPELPALPELAGCLLSDTDWRARQAALRALAGRQEEEVRSLLELGGTDGNPIVRRESGGAIREFDAAVAERLRQAQAAASEAAQAASGAGKATVTRERREATPPTVTAKPLSGDRAP